MNIEYIYFVYLFAFERNLSLRSVRYYTDIDMYLQLEWSRVLFR